MTNTLNTAVQAVGERIACLAQSDGELRQRIRELADLVQSNVATADSSPTTITCSTDTSQLDERDPGFIEARCRLKAEGCRWAAERIRLKAEGADHQVEIAPFDRQIIEKAKRLPDCHLWMNSTKSPTTADPASFDIVGDWFESLAEALVLEKKVRNDLDGNRVLLAEVLQLCAEAQSALRIAIQNIDHDQTNAFISIRSRALNDDIFIERFLSTDDPADPKCSSDMKVRLKTIGEHIDERSRQERRRRKMFNKVRYLMEETGNAKSENQEIPWQAIAATVHEIVQDGVPPSQIELRTLLLPHIDDIPDVEDIPQGFQLVLREIRHFQKTAAVETPITPELVATTEIKNVAKLLKKKKLVLIGGDCRLARKVALEKALGLDELIWVETKPGQSVNTFAPFVAQPDVAAVVLAIRWSSHSYGDVRQFCDRYDKPLVWLPGGYGTNQVASHILGQCSHRLRQLRRREKRENNGE